MSTGTKRPRTISSDDALLQSKIPRTENSNGMQTSNRAESSFSTSGNSGFVQNAGRDININGGITVHQTAPTDGIDRHMLHDTNMRMKNVQHCLDKSEVMKWIYTEDSDTSLSYNAAQKVHLSGTGAWFLDGSQFSQWKEEPGSMLLLYGGPGCGKTVLSCGYSSPHPLEILSDLFSSYAATANVIGFCNLKPLARGYAYFFFDARNDKLQLLAHEKFIRSLITQLSDRCGNELPSALVSLYRACDDGRRAPSLVSLEDTLLQVLECFEGVYIVIDSLDECSEKVDLLNWIESVTSKASGKLHLMASSRPEQTIVQGLASLSESSLWTVSVTELSTEEDIGALIDARLAKMGKWKNPERQKIKAIIWPRSGGMFRWVDLQLNDINLCSSKKDLYEQLESLPTGLYETYTRIVKRNKRPDILLKLLQWLAFSQRDMTVQEIAEVVAVDPSRPEGPTFDPNMRYEEPAEVLNVCYGLVTEVEGIIKLAHFSVKEYLIKHIYPVPGRTSAQLSHSMIAQTCLAQLLYFDKPSILRWSRNMENSRRRIHSSFPLSEYAAAYWVSHYHSASANATNNPRLLKLLKGLFKLPYSYAMTTCVLLPNSKSSETPWLSSDEYEPDLYSWKIGPPLFYASFAGLTELVGHLIEEGADVNGVYEGYTPSTPLLAAIEQGHFELAKLLLEKGAHANTTELEEDSCTALEAAIEAGPLELTELLLRKGADIDANGSESLWKASERGDLEIFKLVLGNGAHLGVRGQEGQTPLQAAFMYGHLEIVKLLLEDAANIGAEGQIYGQALQAASQGGHLGIIQLLLDRGADVNARDNDCGSSLQAASAGGRLEICKLLLDLGADVNAQQGKYGSSLRAASMFGHLEVFKLLLKHGADADIDGGRYTRAVRSAVRMATTGSRHFEILKLLLENGANVDIDGEGGTALLKASSAGHLEVVKLLLNRGANVNSEEDKYFGSPLQAASSCDNPVIVQLLLEHGAHDNVKEGIYGSSLQAASGEGHLDVAKLLLNHRADVNFVATTQGRFHGPPLHAASRGGHLEIVKLLLDHGADINARFQHDSTSLHAASSEGHLKIVQLLLRHGADVNTRGRWAGSSLLAAGKAGHLAIVQLLLEHGADIQAEYANHVSSLLRIASAEGYLEIVKLLLVNGVDVNFNGEDFDEDYPGTALYMATEQGHLEIAQLLKERGARSEGPRYNLTTNYPHRQLPLGLF